MISTTRRKLLGAASIAVTAQTLSSKPLYALIGARPEQVPPIEDPRLKQLIDQCLNSARDAGADYADVRLCHDFTRHYISGASEGESITIGVRALVDGYWGFASSPVWSVLESVRLGKASVLQAKVNTIGRKRDIDFTPLSDQPNGHWTMPVKIDPFEINVDEIEDLIWSMMYHTTVLSRANIGPLKGSFYRSEKAFGSTEGGYFTQRTYRSSGKVSFGVKNGQGGITLDCLSPSGVGFELFREQDLKQKLYEAYEEELWASALPVKPVDVGRYNVVFTADYMADLIGQTIGGATEVDRVMGFEANAGGTSYITQPDQMLGNFKIGGDNFTVLSDRTKHGSVATVRWDDEGATPVDTALIKNGLLTDLQTNREGAGWLKEYYTAQNKTPKSNGSAYCPTASYSPLTHTANLTLQHSDNSSNFNSLVKDVEKGLVFTRPLVDTDFQKTSGFGMGRVFEIKNGERVALIAHAGILFRTPELWKSIIALGGAESVKTKGLKTTKGQPARDSYFSVTAPPALLKDITVIDISRKA